MDTSQTAVVILAAVFIIAAAKLFSAPIKWALKTGLNAVLGFAGLCIFNLIGATAGVTLGASLFNTLVIAFLGLPGFATLLIVKWLFAA